MGQPQGVGNTWKLVLDAGVCTRRAIAACLEAPDAPSKLEKALWGVPVSSWEMLWGGRTGSKDDPTLTEVVLQGHRAAQGFFPLSASFPSSYF